MSEYNRQYVIFNVSEINKVDFDSVMETSKNTLRKSVDGTKTFVKWEGEDAPTFIESLTTKEGPYSHEEIVEILSTEEWNRKFDFPIYNPPPQDQEIEEA